MSNDERGSMHRRRYLAAGLLPSLLAVSGCLRLSTSGSTTGTGNPATEPDPTATDAPDPTATDAPDPTSTDAPSTEPDSEETPTPTEEPSDDGSVSISTADATLVLSHLYENRLSDEQNGIDGRAAASGVSFPATDAGTVVALGGGGDDAGYYDIPDAGLQDHLAEGGSVSLSVWIRPDSLSGWQIAFNGDGMILDLRRDELRFRWYNNGRSVWRISVPTGSVLSAGEWTHLAGVLEAGERATLYADGDAVGRETVPDGVGFQLGEKADHARVGYHPTGDDGAADSHYEGRLDSLRLYRGALTEESVRGLAESR